MMWLKTVFVSFFCLFSLREKSLKKSEFVCEIVDRIAIFSFLKFVQIWIEEKWRRLQNEASK